MAASNFQKRCSSITVERQLGADMTRREIIYGEEVSLCTTDRTQTYLLCSSLLDLVQLTRSTYPVGPHAAQVL